MEIFISWIFQVKDPYEASLAKVVPTANNGSTELVRLHRPKNQDPWFIFQKSKYVWDSENMEFRCLKFPIKNSINYYSQWKGYADDKEIEEAEAKYGQNKYAFFFLFHIMLMIQFIHFYNLRLQS